MSDEKTSVKVSADNDMGIVVLILGLLVLCWGDPDLLDVLAEYCRRYMTRGAA